MTDKNASLEKAAREIAQKTTPRKEAPSGTSLEAKIARASIDVGAFLPDKDNSQFNYKYISADQIAARAGDALAREGVVIFPEVVDVKIDSSQTPKGGGIFVANVALVFHIRASDVEPTLGFDLLWRSVGVDFATPDKALAKAITTGVKYFTMKLLQIGVGNEDGEHENAPETSAPTPKSDSENLDAIAKSITSQTAFYKACQTFFSIGKAGVMLALDGLEPAAWQKAKPGRSVKEALQRVLDSSIAERENDLAD